MKGRIGIIGRTGIIGIIEIIEIIGIIEIAEIGDEGCFLYQNTGKKHTGTKLCGTLGGAVLQKETEKAGRLSPDHM